MTTEARAQTGAGLTLDDYLLLYAKQGRAAVWCRDFEWSYSELEVQVGSYAAGLVANGVATGDVVAVFGNSRPECLAVFLACARIGSVYLGLNPKATLRELEYMCSDAKPVLLVSVLDNSITEAQRATLVELRLRTDGLRIVADTLLGAVPRATFLKPPASVNALAGGLMRRPCAIVYTSGSTGLPKGALLSESGCIRSAEMTWRYWFGGDASIRAIAQHPINHVSWLVCECLSVLVGGGTLFFRERFDAASTLQLIEDRRLTLWLAFPTMVALAMQSDEWGRCDLLSLRRLAFGSSPPIELLKRVRERTDAVFAVSYGLTESHGGAVTASDGDAALSEIATSIGRPVPGIETRIVDDHGGHVPSGAPGELLLRDESVFLGYLNRPEATAEAIDEDGWLHTGDIVTARNDKSLVLVGRTKEMFKSGGYNVYPPEVEGVIGSHPDVIQVAVVDAPDPLWSAVGVAFVVPADCHAFDAADLNRYLRDQLANYKIPKRIVVKSALPRLTNGKIDRSGLRDEARTIKAHVDETTDKLDTRRESD